MRIDQARGRRQAARIARQAGEARGKRAQALRASHPLLELLFVRFLDAKLLLKRLIQDKLLFLNRALSVQVVVAKLEVRLEVRHQ